ncbi:hypothetical protein RVR_8850 [Actinacidiphila reveromycinica]|uniref:Uncharacterized protein n=1 Tax=Actinacidiphila reveromycinica TaxID=659352 RepID=A0A7U3UZG8_9ACTN|nr:hypothetical protein RVR_8850 [Streptomyces sp. SN-593]
MLNPAVRERARAKVHRLPAPLGASPGHDVRERLPDPPEKSDDGGHDLNPFGTFTVSWTVRPRAGQPFGAPGVRGPASGCA